MWENETIVLVTSLKKRIIGDNEKIRIQSIETDTAIPPFIKNIFKIRVDHYISTESPITLQATTHFEMDEQTFKDLQSQYYDILKASAVFPAKEIEDILKEALILRLDYLIKPVDTMRRMLFENKSNITLTEMETIFDSLKKVLPYAEEVIKECTKQGKSLLDQETFGRVASDILYQAMSSDPVKTVMNDLSVLTDFLSETKGEEIIRLEGSLIQEFLVDRNQWGFRRAIDVEVKLGRDSFSAKDLELTLKRYLELKNEFSKEEKAPLVVETTSPAPIETKPVIKEEKIEEPVVEKTPSFDIEPEPEKADLMELEESFVEESVKPKEKAMEEISWNLDESLIEETSQKQPETKVEETIDTPEEAVVEEPEVHPKPKAKPKQMRIIRREQNKEDDDLDTLEHEEKRVAKETLGQSQGLLDYIDTKMEKGFIKKLFGGDASEYQNLISQLNTSESWREAKILIDNELFKRDVDPFSREAIKLVDLVYGLFYPEEGVGGKK